MSADGFVIPVKLIDGAVLRLAVTVEPENVSIHVATADAVSVLRCALCAAGAPDVTAVIVAVTPAGHDAPVTSENVPATPLDPGNVAFAVLLGAIVVDVLAAPDDGLAAGLGLDFAGTDDTPPPPPPPQPATSPARRKSDPAHCKRLNFISPRSPDMRTEQSKAKQKELRRCASRRLNSIRVKVLASRYKVVTSMSPSINA